MRRALILACLLSACSSSNANDTPTPDSAVEAKLFDVEAFAEVQATEGIAFGNGTLYVGASGALHKIAADGAAQKWIDLPGALGIAVRANGRLVVCGKDDSGAGVLWDVAPDGTKAILAAGFKQPNFVAIAPDDSIVFTDSAADRVYRTNGDGSAKTVIADSIVYPNGLAFSKDGKQLYVASWKGKKVVSLARNSDGTYDAPVTVIEGPENVDGLAVGASGDLYLIANGLGVLRVRNGRSETIAPGSKFKLAANAAFGVGAYGQTWLYVTNLIGPSVSRVLLDEPGAPLPVR